VAITSSKLGLVVLGAGFPQETDPTKTRADKAKGIRRFISISVSSDTNLVILQKDTTWPKKNCFEYLLAIFSFPI
jgi:hypothetical protein